VYFFSVSYKYTAISVKKPTINLLEIRTLHWELLIENDRLFPLLSKKILKSILLAN